MGEYLSENPNPNVPAQVIMRLFNIIQGYFVFEFDGQKYQQRFGTSMGSKSAHPNANNFMAKKVYPQVLSKWRNIYKILQEIPG